MSKPGPWTARRYVTDRYDSDTDYEWDVVHNAGGGRFVVIAYGLGESVARMVAAAPELLAALQGIVHADNIPLVMSDSHSRVLIDAALAAIAKATAP